MHFPELALQVSGFGRLGSQEGFIMEGERKMAVDNAHFLRILFVELLQHGSKVLAARSLIIAVFQNGYRCIIRSKDMILFGDLREEGNDGGIG